MPSKTLSCGCIIDWSEKGTKLSMCGMHQLQFKLWDGTEEEFVKMVATPNLNNLREEDKFDPKVLSESR
jgi:hypothetical protein